MPPAPGVFRAEGWRRDLPRRQPLVHGVSHRPAQLDLPVLSTFVICVLALLTVELKLAPCMSDFIIVGMIWSVWSAVDQFFAFSG